METNASANLALTGKLLVCIVDRGYGDELMSLGKENGAGGGTILLGRGTGSSALLQMLGISDTRKELVLTLASDETAQNIIAAFAHSERSRKKIRGVLFQVDVNALLKASVLTKAQKDTAMNASHCSSHELITVIANAGYAEDVMAYARKAGASGGTILHGRGTAREEDSTFFGITIVPEKDIILILAPAETSRQILEAIRTADCLQQPGMGIAFCTPVEKFVPLGKK